jgi:hypothetical protein
MGIILFCVYPFLRDDESPAASGRTPYQLDESFLLHLRLRSAKSQMAPPGRAALVPALGQQGAHIAGGFPFRDNMNTELVPGRGFYSTRLAAQQSIISRWFCSASNRLAKQKKNPPANAIPYSLMLYPGTSMYNPRANP